MENKKRLTNIHPGEVLQEEFLIPLKISTYALANEIHISQTRIAAILSGKRHITTDAALKLSGHFNTSPEFWLGLQHDFDVEEEKLAKEPNS